MVRKLLLIMLLISAVCVAVISKAQAQLSPLDGIKICLDPGHGGQDSDDRETDLGVGTLYYEAAANWEAVGYLDSMLTSLGAVTKLTRLTDDPDAPDRDPSLSDRVQVGNAFGADYFHSFHTNGVANQEVNYSLILYAGPEDGIADFPESFIMAEIMDDEIFKVMRTTTTFARADIPFTGFTNGLGVLNNLNMPSTLSEASFHSNLNEGRRLMNSAYRKSAAWSIVKSFLKFYNQDALPFGEVGGLVTDNDGNALNDIEITFAPGTPQEKVYNGDQFLNGYYMFDRINPGTYDVRFDKFGYEAQIKSITIEAGLYTEIDASLNVVGGAPSEPKLTFIGNPGTETGVSAAWEQNPETTLLGYRLYYAIDDSLNNWALAADENLLTATTTTIAIASADSFLVIPSNPVHHFKLTAVATSGAESEAGDIYSRSSNAAGDKILIVDGFDRVTASYQEEFHDFATDYLIAIRDSRSAVVHTAANEAIIDGQINPEDYEMVVWFVGDESTNSETFSLEEQMKVSAFLKSGGKLLATGSEIAWDLGNRGDSLDRVFLNNYLKASYVGDGAINFTPATGIVGTDFANLTINFGIAYVEDFPDDIAPENGAISILDYAVDGARAGVAYRGLFPEGTEEGGVVYVSFGIETANPGAQRLLIKDALNYLDVGEFYEIPPAQPTLSELSITASGVSVNWEANTDKRLEGYRLYYATDNSLADWQLAASEETLSRETVSVTISTDDFIVAPAGDAYHFRLTAISEGGFESPPSDTYSAASGGETNVLIVDGFDRFSGSYASSSHAFAKSYHQGLITNEAYNISTVSNEHVTSESFDLNAYDIVFWFLGDESTVKETFSAAEQGAVEGYLEQGGKLFVSGAEVGWDLFDRGSAQDKAFFNNYLKAGYVSDGGNGLSPATGLPDTEFSDLVINFGIVYPEDFPDEIEAFEGSTNALSYSAGTFAGIAYTGTFGSSTEIGKLVYFAFPLETADAATMIETLAVIGAYFKDPDPVTGVKSIVVSSLEAGLYPNPSSATTTLALTLGETAEPTSLQMVIFNAKGQEQYRKTLQLQQGVNQFDLETQNLKSGMYFIHLSNKETKATLKLLKR